MRKQLLKFLVAALCIVTMLFSSFLAVSAQVVTDSNASKRLPDFIEGSIAMMYPNATDSQLAEIRAQWAEQIRLKETRIVETNGAVLNVQPSITRGTSCINSIVKEEPLQGGQLTGASYVIGVEDNLYARFLTTGPNQGSGLSAKLSGINASGDVYVRAKYGQTGAGKQNYIIVWGGNSTIDWNWVPIGYAQVSSSSADYYYIGPVGAGKAYNYTSIGTNTMMNIYDYNDVMVDWVWFKDY